jgi:hypothetical protein
MEQFQESINDMKNANLIERSNSPWSSPIHIVRKDGGAIRITQDYKKLNSVTLKDAYPLPNIENMLSRLAKGITVNHFLILKNTIKGIIHINAI